MNKLILITGDLASGKSTLANKLSKELGILCFTKDVLKEILSDDIGFSTRQENKNLSIASVNIMKHIFEQYAFLQKDLILEANFHKDEFFSFVDLARTNNYKITLLYLEGQIDELFDRFTNRIKAGRHPTHCTSDIIDKNGFEKYLIANRKEVDEFFISDISNKIDFYKIIVKDNNYEEVFSQAAEYIS